MFTELKSIAQALDGALSSNLYEFQNKYFFSFAKSQILTTPGRAIFQNFKISFSYTKKKLFIVDADSGFQPSTPVMKIATSLN